MINSLDLSSRLAIDTKSIDDLHLLSKQDSKKALQEAARQFEALFLQMLVKSMRDATLKSGLIDSQHTQFYTEMYDQQLAQSMSAKGIGLADMMVEQLTRTYPGTEKAGSIDNTATENPLSPAYSPVKKTDDHHAALTVNHFHQPWTNAIRHAQKTDKAAVNVLTQTTDKSHQLWPDSSAAPQVWPSAGTAASDDSISDTLSSTETQTGIASGKTEAFIHTLMPHAHLASESTGIPAHFMLAQAALESGWGKHEIRHPDNSPSYNLFGIKAGNNWKGETVETITTEYINGIPKKTIEKFRAYNSYEEGFRDYANLLSSNPRYAEVLNTQNADAFANGLQQAGYATDPQYADKLLRILNNSILYRQNTI